MFRFEADLAVFLHREPIDFRAGINSLVALVEQSMQLDPFARTVLPFTTTNATGSSCCSTIATASG